MNNRITKLLILLFSLNSISSCKNIDDNNQNITCEVSTYKILVDTPYETSCYLYKSSVEGPRVALIGGIHGDEQAGWKAALQLIDKKDYKGEVLLIPQANILADNITKRYIGVGNSGKITTVDSNKLLNNNILSNDQLDSIKTIKYTDLNRSFPGNSNGTVTEKIASAIYEEVVNFNPDYVVDFHESRKDYTNYKVSESSIYLGNSVIFNDNGFLTADEIVRQYNLLYTDEGEIDFSIITSNVANSFNYTLGNDSRLPNVKTFTFETNRKYSLGIDTNSIDLRIKQHLRLTDILLNVAYSEYLEGLNN